ncbi:hypothetical protein HPB48_004749 [Haemaphysalis longicornis]|uniref:RNase H type-1 domain-containing protein n=1 Tax=Haemaphysalis longicornis TaxID=44386 RepID=A0A9J6FZT5_HAELO|nr:hypothetical protein HPB48_004749 [Haemaphysalis longicornis]
MTIIIDCQAACRRYVAGAVSSIALRLPSKTPPSRTVRIVWTPAHSDLPGNDTAHAVTNRAPEEDHGPTSIETFQEITEYYRLGRRTFPPPNPVCLKCRKTH